MATVEVIEARDCPDCGEPMYRLDVRPKAVWTCAECTGDDDEGD